jgi:hypothetical protein
MHIECKISAGKDYSKEIENKNISAPNITNLQDISTEQKVNNDDEPLAVPLDHIGMSVLWYV